MESVLSHSLCILSDNGQALDSELKLKEVQAAQQQLADSRAELEHQRQQLDGEAAVLLADQARLSADCERLEADRAVWAEARIAEEEVRGAQLC